jgi:hypothetical protein
MRHLIVVYCLRIRCNVDLWKNYYFKISSYDVSLLSICIGLTPLVRYRTFCITAISPLS